MKKLLSFLLVALMMLCLFAGCGDKETAKEKQRDYKEEVFTALSQLGAPIAISGTANTTANVDGEEQKMDVAYEVAVKDSTVSAKIDVTSEGTTETVNLYLDSEAVYVGAQGTTLKIAFSDIETIFSEALAQATAEMTAEDVELFNQLMDELKKLISKEKLEEIYNKSMDSYKAAVTNCTVSEADGQSVYTLTIDSAKLNESYQTILTDFVNEFIDSIYDIAVAQGEAIEQTEIDDAKAEISEMLKGISISADEMVVTLADGQVKTVSSKSTTSVTLEGQTTESKADTTVNITATGDAVVVDDSITANAMNFMDLFNAMGGMDIIGGADSTVMGYTDELALGM